MDLSLLVVVYDENLSFVMKRKILQSQPTFNSYMIFAVNHRVKPKLKS